MSRFLTVALAIVMLALSSATRFIVSDADCAEACPDDEAAERCGSDCADCFCCAGSRTLVLPVGARVPTGQTAEPMMFEHSTAPRSPDPDEIQHVPIAA